MQVVLSHPFSGAFYWWLAAQSDSGEPREKRPRSTYYRTLYGNVDRNLDVALTSLVVFEEIVLAGADVGAREFVRSGEEVRLPALDILGDSACMVEAIEV